MAVSYQVFARKYRPKTFADVLGQEHVVRTLRNAIAQNRLAHAYLFVGPRGTGKTSTARIFAKALNCPNGPSVDFDPEDEICQEIAEGRSLDVLEIDGASNNGVDQVRDLRESVKYAPSRCRYKIYYIDEVHMLSTAAFNALLKTLEEPPEHVKFIFATTEANKILPTIISRCQRFDLRRIPNTIIAHHLLHIASLEGVDLDEKAAFAIAKGADGGMRDAQSMLDQLVAFCGNQIRENDVLEIFGFTAAQSVSQLVQHILESDTVGALRLVHETSESGKDLGRMLSDLIQYFRTLLVSQADTDAAAEDLEPEIADRVNEQSQMASTEQLLRIVDGLAEVDARMRWATNKRLHFELGVIQAVQHYNEISISDVIQALDGGAEALPRPSARPQPPVTVRRAAAPALEPRSTAPVSTPQAVAPASVREPASTAATLERVVPPAIAESSLAAPPEPKPETKVAPVSEPETNFEDEPSLLQDEPETFDAPAETEPWFEDEGPSSPVQIQAPEPEAAVPSFTNEEFRLELLNLVRSKRPLASAWLESTTVLSMDRGTIKLGFPTSESHAKESLDRDNQRTFLEALAEEILGKPMKFQMVVDPSLKPPPPAELFAFDLPVANPAPAPAKPSTAPIPVVQKAADDPAATAPAIVSPTMESTASPEDVAADFQNDPLIKSAIEKFKLKLAASAPQS